MKLVPTCELPFQWEDVSSTRTLCEWQTTIKHKYLKLGHGEHEVTIFNEFSWLSTAEINQLAKGYELATPLGKIEAPGRLRMLGGYEDRTLVMLVLEFLPDEPVAQGMPFHSWYHLRFPEDSSYLHESRNEAWWLHFHRQWVEETQPAPTLTPDDGLLHMAVLNNHEYWVEAILQDQPRIEVGEGSDKTITETALGIAMENTGMFGAGPGFACGCHRHYRDDDFCEAEDPETWVPRAERIAERLKAAGAIDYSPLLEACREGRADDVEAMLKAGFPPNFSIYGHTTALCEAVHTGHEDICDLLLCHGADPNLPRPFSTSMAHGGQIYPLTLAIDHPNILKLLLQAGADPHLYHDDMDETPILLCRNFHSQDQAEAVFEMVDFQSIRGRNERSGVFYLNPESLTFCRNLISAELLDQPDGRGVTPLLQAIIMGDASKARRLIEMGADPFKPGMIWQDEANLVLRFDSHSLIRTQHISPIRAALQTGNLDLIEFMLDHRSSPKRQSVDLAALHLESKATWMAQLEDAIAQLNEVTEAFAEALNPEHPDEYNCADTCDLLAPLKHAEKTLIVATLHITGKRLKALNLCAEVCAHASGDFKGGTARAYRDAETTGEVGFDDFIEALSEHFQSGSTMDHGKLLQAVQQVAKRLEKHCAKLRKAI